MRARLGEVTLSNVAREDVYFRSCPLITRVGEVQPLAVVRRLRDWGAVKVIHAPASPIVESKLQFNVNLSVRNLKFNNSCPTFRNCVFI